MHDQMFCIVCGSKEAIIDLAANPARTDCRTCGSFFHPITRDFISGYLGLEAEESIIVASRIDRAAASTALRQRSDAGKPATWQTIKDLVAIVTEYSSANAR